MAAPQGLFSGLTPEAVAAQEALKQRETNLSLAQSANPLAGSLYSSYNMADETKKNIADIFGNPVEDSPQVKAAKDEQQIQQQIAQIMAEGNSQGLGKAEIAAKVKEFLLSKNKVDKAMQYESLNLDADKTKSEIDKNKAQTDEATQKAMVSKAALIEPATRLASLKAKFPNVDVKILEGAAQDPKSFIDFMTGRNVETAEGVYTVRPVGAPERVGSVVDRATKIDVNTGTKANLTAAGTNLEAVQQQLIQIPQKLSTIDQQISAVEKNPMILGTGAQERLKVAGAFATLGISNPQEIAKIADTQKFIAAQTDLILKDLNNKLGGGVSTSDVEFIKSKFGEITNNPQAISSILKHIRGMYLEQNKTLKQDEARLIKTLNEGKASPVDNKVPMPPEPVAAPQVAPAPYKTRAEAGQWFAANKAMLINNYKKAKNASDAAAAAYVEKLMADRINSLPN